MAVIKQQQQFRNQRIGVVRADSGQQQMWQQVGQFADNLVSNAFESAKVKADERGVEIAQQLSEEELRTIDPVTGRIKAFNVPQNFGTVAQQSYKRVIEKRYVRSIEQEVKLKAAEIALQYQFDPQGPEKYSSAMEDYVSKMVKTGDPQFQEMIKEVGGTYLASTKLNMMQKRAEAQRENMQLDLGKDADELSLQMSDLAGTPDAQVLFDQFVQEQEDAVNSGMQTDSMAADNIAKVRRARLKGVLLPNLAYGAQVEDDVEINPVTKKPITQKRGITEADAAIIENSLATGNRENLKALPTSLQKAVNGALDMASDAEDIRQLRIAVTTARSQLSQATTVDTNLQKLVSNYNEIAAGNGDHTNAKHKDAADWYVLTQAGVAGTGQEAGYYRSSASLTDVNIQGMAEEGVLPKGLTRDLSALANGRQFEPQEIQNLMQHYLKYSSYTSGQGVVLNKLTQLGFDKEDDALLRAASFIAVAEGSEDLPRLITTLRANAQNKDLINARTREVLKLGRGDEAKTVMEYAIDKFDGDLMAAQVVEPYIRYMVAGGNSRDEIDDVLTQIYESTYTKTEGFVIDPLYGVTTERSMFSLNRAIPNQVVRDQFKVAVANALPEGFHFGKGGEEGSTRVYLVPQVLSGTAVSDQLGSSSVVYHAMYRDTSGALIPFPKVTGSDGQEFFMTFSTARMRDLAEREYNKMRQEELEGGAATPEQIEAMEFGSQIGRTVDPIPFESDMSTITTKTDSVLDYEME